MPRPECREHDVDDSALGAEFVGVVEQCLGFVELTAFVEKLPQQRASELGDIGGATGRQQRDSDALSQVRFGAGDVELLVRGDRGKTVSVGNAECPGGLLMEWSCPLLPAKRVIEVPYPKRTK
ncbi:hypothetical protein NIIDMKKI_53400 [Mycobacterium kansasii]|uniref:Uncharacterized protein n=1 Tax=Mycobacterium kansasii TaxID=1768 RepID=A0A7G1II63_MYCKA|nr:hypothetical protein NIIDMKKI_53400 [Mycobacterium kansasii]